MCIAFFLMHSMPLQKARLKGVPLWQLRRMYVAVTAKPNESKRLKQNDCICSRQQVAYGYSDLCYEIPGGRLPGSLGLANSHGKRAGELFCNGVFVPLHAAAFLVSYICAQSMDGFIFPLWSFLWLSRKYRDACLHSVSIGRLLALESFI
jgi:hypothetical protein